MKLTVLPLVIVALTVPALADRPATPAEGEKIQAAIKAWGCSGGDMEQETDDGVDVFEVNDAACPGGGQYDIKLDKDFRVISVSQD